MKRAVQLVGILNITPDSFSDGGVNFSAASALNSAKKLLADGAGLLDIGAESTNPKSVALTATQEIERLKDILPELLQRYPGKISLDTYHPETLVWALTHGKVILNDVTGLDSPEMQKLAARHSLTCIVSHLPRGAAGLPINAHTIKPLANVDQVKKELLQQVTLLNEAGVKSENIILDPGIGFGKSMQLNWELLKFAALVPSYQVMIGHSNKRFLGCDSKTGELLPNAQTLRFSAEQNRKAAEIALRSDAAFLRVHEIAIYQDLLF